jgi:hypothetical protein
MSLAWRRVVFGTKEIEMSEEQTVEKDIGRSSTHESEKARSEGKKLGSYRAALKRLVHLPWLAGLAAVGGVLVTAVLGPQLVPTGASGTAPAIANVFNGDNTSLLLVAAVFGLTPDLIIRRLEQQTEKYKADLESTQSTQSTESGVRNESGAKNAQLA